MEFLVIIVVIGLLPAFIASSKGRDFVTWWVYGSLLFIIALPHSLIMSADQKAVEGKQLATGDMRKCPHCAEVVKREAKVCRYCQRDLPPEEIAAAAPSAATGYRV
jgi:hypothetical protein